MAKRWYIVHAYSNFERKVAEAIKERAQQHGLSDLFDEVLVPTEEVVEIRRGRKVASERKFFPGYVLVKMELTDQAYHLIKNTPKVTGFLGAENKPMPISECRGRAHSRPGQGRCRAAEADGLLRDRRAGSRRRRPFASFSGLVEEIDEERARLKVAVSIFGRATPSNSSSRRSRKSARPKGSGSRRGPGNRPSRQPKWGKLLCSGKGRGRRAVPAKGRLPPHHGPFGVWAHWPGKGCDMAKKIDGYINLVVPAGQANPSPPIGPALGSRGVNIMGFCKDFNAKTQGMEQGMPVPCLITVFSDKSFTFEMKTPPASYLLRKAAQIEKGSGTTGRGFVGKVTMAQVKEVAKVKLKDLNTDDVNQGARIIAGTARSMGIEVVE